MSRLKEARQKAEEEARKKNFSLDAVLGGGKRKADHSSWINDEERAKRAKIAEEASRVAMLDSIESTVESFFFLLILEILTWERN